MRPQRQQHHGSSSSSSASRVGRMTAPFSSCSVMLLAAAVALVGLAMTCQPAEALPYRDVGFRGSDDDDRMDLMRLLLGGVSGDSDSDASADDALRHLLAMEHRRRVLAKQNLLARRQPTQADVRAKRRGSCLFHAGLANNCDFRDVVGAVNEASHWGSEISPGKRR